MPTQTYHQTAKIPGTSSDYTINWCNRTWTHSPKVDGKLKLRTNPYANQKTALRFVRFTPGADGTCTGFTYRTTPASWNLSDFTALNNKAYARFLDKVEEAKSSALLMQIAGLPKAREMLDKRVAEQSRLLRKRLDELKTRRGARRLRQRAKHFKKKGRLEDASSLYLEGIFGWAPLFQDIHDSLSVLSSRDINATRFLTGRASSTTFHTAPQGYGGTQNASIVKRSVSGGSVTITNPNAFLASRLGALDAAQTAWDLVPWSFVVNMFVNTNQMISNFDSHAGVSFSGRFLTTSFKGVFYGENVQPGGKRTVYSYTWLKTDRVLRSTDFSWQVRVPSLDMRTLATASALLVQRATKIAALASKILQRV